MSVDGLDIICLYHLFVPKYGVKHDCVHCLRDDFNRFCSGFYPVPFRCLDVVDGDLELLVRDVDEIIFSKYSG